MELPPGVKNQGGAMVAKLSKAIYGLKQAGRKWYEALCTVLADLGTNQCDVDPGIFYSIVDGFLVILVIHVDDCLITGVSEVILDEFRSKLHRKFN